MTNYELMPTVALHKNTTFLKMHDLPEIVHLDDPALAVLIDFDQAKTCTLKETASMEEAIHEMTLHEVHLLAIINAEYQIVGILTSEDVLGEKPIKYIQEYRLARNQLLAHMLMTPVETIPAFTMHSIKTARVGNIVKTLHAQRASIGLVIAEEHNKKIVLGCFTTTQISKQLHHNVRL